MGEALARLPEEPPATPEDLHSVEITLAERWPDIELEFSEQNLFGTSSLPTNPDARLRTVVRSLQDSAPEALPVLDKPLTKHRDEQRRFLTSPVTIKKEKYPRVVFVDMYKVFSKLWDQLSEVNHPVAQAVTEVARKNRARVVYNLGQPESRHVPVIKPDTMEQLAQDLLLTTHSEAIRAAFNDRIAELKKAEPLNPE